MIPFDFEYYKPSTAVEALNVFSALSSRGAKPLYYSGGTEIISMARRSDIYARAVIDIKGIPECNVLQLSKGRLITGAVLTLTSLEETNLFPLLGEAARKVGDHTVRDKITLGGNICGRIVFREAVLPFLLCDSQVIIAGENGFRVQPIVEVFKRQLKLKKGEILVQLITDEEYIRLPYMSIKRTTHGDIGYPLASVDVIKKDDKIRIAFSGITSYPFRSLEIEEDINNNDIPMEQRVDNAISHLPAPINDNLQGSAEYRKFVLRNILFDVIAKLGRG